MRSDKGKTLETILGKTTLTETGCREWQGSFFDNGYGQIWFEGTNRRVHKVVFSLVNDVPLNEQDTVRHTCDNRKCCEPSHLVHGTQLDNIKDRQERKRSSHGSHIKKVCIHGHEMTKENTYMERGMSRCRECRRSRVQKCQMKPRSV